MKLFPVILLELILLVSFLFSCSEQRMIYTDFGTFKVDSTGAIPLETVVKKFIENSENSTFTFSAPIVDVCQTAGCWVNVQRENGELIRVRFKDHFLIPTKTKLDELAFFHGSFYMDTISIAMQKHFAEDAKKSKEEIEKILSPKLEINFEADGILVKSMLSINIRSLQRQQILH